MSTYVTFGTYMCIHSEHAWAYACVSVYTGKTRARKTHVHTLGTHMCVHSNLTPLVGARNTSGHACTLHVCSKHTLVYTRNKRRQLAAGHFHCTPLTLQASVTCILTRPRPGEKQTPQPSHLTSNMNLPDQLVQLVVTVHFYGGAALLKRISMKSKMP